MLVSHKCCILMAECSFFEFLLWWKVRWRKPCGTPVGRRRPCRRPIIPWGRVWVEIWSCGTFFCPFLMVAAWEQTLLAALVLKSDAQKCQNMRKSIGQVGWTLRGMTTYILIFEYHISWFQKLVPWLVWTFLPCGCLEMCIDVVLWIGKKKWVQNSVWLKSNWHFKFV